MKHLVELVREPRGCVGILSSTGLTKTKYELKKVI